MALPIGASPPESEETVAPRAVSATFEKPLADFRLLFEEHVDRVWRTLRALGVHPSFVDDALQDVFVVVHARRGEFRGDAKLSTWIYAIAYRVALNYRRKIKKQHADLELGDQLTTGARDPEESMVESRNVAFVHRLSETLSEGVRDVFVLCLLEERGAPEVAQLLGVPLNTVYSRMRLGRDALRRALEEERRRESVESGEQKP